MEIGQKRKQKFNETTIYKDLTTLSNFVSNTLTNMRSDYKEYTIESLKCIAESRALFRQSFTDENIENKKKYLIACTAKISCTELFLENLYTLRAITQGLNNEITKYIAKIEFEIENFSNFLNNKN